MKLSEVIEEIKREIELYGDLEVLSYKFTHLHASSESWKLSPTRRDKKGQRVRMNLKEFKQMHDKEGKYGMEGT